MKFTVTHKCGHEVVYQLYGKFEDRERKAAYYETLDCPECRRRHELEQAETNAQADNLPELKGSEKQIAWAMSIRNKWMGLVSNLIAQVNANTNANPQLKEKFMAAITSRKGETSAAWWIDNRYSIDTVSGVLEDLNNIIKG